MARIEARIDGTLPKYYSIPNRQLKNSIQEVIDDDLFGKEKLPEARNLKELD